MKQHQISETSLNYTIKEELPGDTNIGDIALDAGFISSPGNTAATIQFGTMRSTHKEYFYLSPAGVLRTSMKTLNREQICYKIISCIIDIDLTLISPVFKIIHVQITVVDLNDNVPRFQTSRISLSVPESLQVGAMIVLPTADDLDSGDLGVERYEIESNDFFSLLVSIAETVGRRHDVRLVMRKQLDREVDERLTLKVTAFDGGQPQLSSTILVDIVVQDSNDNSPSFAQNLYEITIQEESEIIIPVLRITADDPDEGLNGQVIYRFGQSTSSMYGELFEINNITGDIYLLQRLDYETKTKYVLVVSGSDLGPGSIPSYVTVIVHVEDVNDHPPEITINTLNVNGEIEVMENQPIGTIVTHISVEDADFTSRSETECECELESTEVLLKKQYRGIFAVVTLIVFDRENLPKYHLKISCTDNGTPPFYSSTDVELNILDQNDNAPHFSGSEILASLIENEKPGVFLLQIIATDLDEKDNAVVTYSIKEDTNQTVSIDSQTGIISSGMTSVDREAVNQLLFHVGARDMGTPVLSSEIVVRLIITDVNDESPQFSSTNYTFSVFENQISGQEIGTLNGFDHDLSPFDAFLFSIFSITLFPDKTFHNTLVSRYSLNAQESTEVLPFSIDPHSGSLVTAEMLDREVVHSYGVVVMATNIEAPYLSSSSYVLILIEDDNDHSPVIQFPLNQTIVQVPLNSDAGFRILKVIASDQDQSRNAMLTYSMTQENEHNLFSLNSQTGELTLSRRINSTESYKIIQNNITLFEVEITVSDCGLPKRWTSTTLIVHITPALRKKSTFLEYSNFYEYSFAGILVLITSVTVIIISFLLIGIVLTSRRLINNRGTRGRRRRYLNLPFCNGKTYNIINVEKRQLEEVDMSNTSSPQSDGSSESQRSVKFNMSGRRGNEAASAIEGMVKAK